MPTLDTLIVDDERLVRSELRRMLEPRDEVTVVGEAADATEAEAAVEELGPDLLLLDVQMPGDSGFDLLKRLDEVPHVVFVTAYEEYAIRAFEVNALDHLVKPVQEERLADALETVQEQAALGEEARGPAPQPEDQPEPSGGEEPDMLTAEDRVFVKDGRRCWFVRLGTVRLFEAAGNYTRLYFEGEEPLIHRSLSYLEERLDPGQYFRASRQHIFNLDRVEAMNSRPDGKLVAHLSGDLNVELSHRRSRTFREERSL
jgi:two-component system LytT family response regulator